MKQDIVFAARLFRRRPGLFGVTVAGLAIAIGLSIAVFSIVQGVVFAGYGIQAPESVYRVALTGGAFTRVTGDSPHQGNWAFSDYSRLQQATSSLDLVASARTGAEYRAGINQGAPESVSVMAVSDNYFSLLGLGAALGRTFTAADAGPGISNVVVSHGFWKNRLGADPSIVGQTIWLSDLPFTVVGVAARSHSVPGYIGMPPAFWTTLAANEEAWVSAFNAGTNETRSRLQALKLQGGLDATERARLTELEADLAAAPPQWNPAVDVFGRVKPGVTRAQAEAEARSIAGALASERGRDGVARRPAVQLQPLDEQRGDSIIVAAVLMTTVSLVVILACANVTNILLANAAARRREIGTRLAVGASRGRVVRQLLTESLMLGLLGGALGLMIAKAIMPSFAALVQVPPAFDVTPDISAYAFVGLLATAAGIMAGLAPARYGRRGDLMSALKTDQIAAPSPTGRGLLRSLLIGAQAAVSVVLLVLAALLTRALVQNARLDPGYDATHLLNVSVGYGVRGSDWTAPRKEAYWNAAVEQVRQLGGVASASLASIPPFSGVIARQVLNGRRIHRNEASPEYFSTLGVRLLRGRIYTPDELRAQAPVAVISATLARDFWGTDDPIGATLERVWGPDDATSSKLGLLRKPAGTRVIGVVADVTMRLEDHNAPTIYLPLAQTSVPRLVVRTEQDPRALVRPIRETLEALDPSVRVSTNLALDGLKRELETPRILASLAVLVGAIALGLAVIGLFGVTAFVVEHRIHEVSVRRALGATDGQLLRMLLRESLRPVAIGLAFGLFLSLLGGRIVEGVLYGVSSRDPLAIVAAVVVLLLASTAAVFLPARRAAGVNPAQLLKLG